MLGSRAMLIIHAPNLPIARYYRALCGVRGHVRGRHFAPSAGKREDEACGSACMVLAERLDRNLTVVHGRFNSLITVRPWSSGVECGGRCILQTSA